MKIIKEKRRSGLDFCAVALLDHSEFLSENYGHRFELWGHCESALCTIARRGGSKKINKHCRSDFERNLLAWMKKNI